MVRAVTLADAIEERIEFGVDRCSICLLEPAHDMQDLFGWFAVDHRVTNLREEARVAYTPIPGSISTRLAVETGDLPDCLEEAEERRGTARRSGAADLASAL